jgi:hypothetical protein
MTNTNIPESISPRAFAANLIHMSGGIDPDFVQITEMAGDTLGEYDITDEDVIEEFAMEVDKLISTAIVTVQWADADEKYVYNEPKSATGR